MAHVEIYKLRKTAPPEVREYSVFDYMKRNIPPAPAHYIKEWAGEMHGTLPLTIPGRLYLEPPKDYYGGTIKNGDIAIVDGKPFYFDKLEGAKFIKLDSFEADSVRTAKHVKYGWFVDIKGAEAISDKLAYICADIGVPAGYLGEQKPGGIYNGRRPFLPGAADENSQHFLHPQFLNGEEAREFIALISELSEAERWDGIAVYLRDRIPITARDLQFAREQFAPELLLPAVLRPLAKHIPADADQAELDYLAAKIGGMDDSQRKVFNAVVEAGWFCYDAAEIINLTENLDCFDLEPDVLNEREYGEFRLENDWDICEAAVRRLEKSEDPADQFLVKYITLLGRCAEEETYGCHAAKEDGGAFTKHGYITQVRDIEVIYRSSRDIPADYEVQPPAAPEPSSLPSAAPEPEIKPVMVRNTDLAALLLEMHAVGGDYMRDASYNVKTLAKGGDDFFVMMNAGMIIVTPVDLVFRKDTHEHETWMLADKAPDVRAFVMSVTDRADGRITGNVFEADLYALQDYLRENSFYFTHLDAEMKDGTSRRFTLEEWDEMDLHDRDQLKSWSKYYDPADEARLATYSSVLRWAVEENRQPVEAGEFLSQINERFMAQANNPQPNMFRLTQEAAKEILAQDTAYVYRLTQGGADRLSPIDAVKTDLWHSADREFAIERQGLAGLEKWARRSAGEMLRQTERGQRDKVKNKNEEL